MTTTIARPGTRRRSAWWCVRRARRGRVPAESTAQCRGTRCRASASTPRAPAGPWAPRRCEHPGAGVLSGAHDRAALETVPHTEILDSIAEFPGLVTSAWEE